MEYDFCTFCDGTGEGRVDGQRCWACAGTGIKQETLQSIERSMENFNNGVVGEEFNPEKYKELIEEEGE